MTKVTTFDDVPQLIGSTLQGHSDIETLSWKRVHVYYDGDENHKINLNPEFQRGHVWTLEQQTKFVEYGLRGGQESMTIIFNCDRSTRPWTFTCVDGLQRITAVYRFLHDEVKVFGGLTCSEMIANSKNKVFPLFDYRLNISTVYLSDADVLRFYLELNSNGTPHHPDEIKKVQRLLQKLEK